MFLEIERRVSARTTALVAVSTAIRDQLLDLQIGRPEQWRVIPLGLDLGPLIRNPLSREEARARLGMAVGPQLVGIVGRLVPIKDHATFVASAVVLSERLPGVEFVIAGDGASRQDIERIVPGRLRSRMHFTGWVHDLQALYRALDVVVLTSRNEGTPVALIEAGASQLPVVATDVGGVSDVVRDRETGYLVPAGDAHGVADRTFKLLSDPSMHEAFGKAAARQMISRYGAERLVSDTAALYNELLEVTPH
jgi:glycosyltransferase involved in cell wall biosynthesis